MNDKQEEKYAHILNEIRGNLREYSYGLKQMEKQLRKLEDILDPPLKQ